jgi:hypothetical protein
MWFLSRNIPKRNKLVEKPRIYGQLKKFLFLVTAAIFFWFSGFRGEDLNVIFYQNMPNLHNRYKSAERKISMKTETISYINKRNIILKFLFLLFYPKHLRAQNTENHAINLFWQKGEFQDVDLRPAELRSAPDSIKLCNWATYYMLLAFATERPLILIPVLS